MKKLIIFGLCMILLLSIVSAQRVTQEQYESNNPTMNITPLNSNQLIKLTKSIYDLPKSRNYSRAYVVRDVLYRETNCINVVGRYKTTIQLYHCVSKNLTMDCPGGIITKTGRRTRCFDFNGQSWWYAEYCKEGWVMI